MSAESQDPQGTYDAYLATCLQGCAEDPDSFLARHPKADTEERELVRALHREYARTPPGANEDALPFDTLGDYRLLRPLGSGGMGAVYLAEQEALHRQVALKVVHRELGVSDTMLRRFQREALAIARLRHPGIVSVYELGEDQGVQFIAMELVPGKPLDELLRGDEQIPVQRLLQWMAQVGRALAYAHEQGVVHRDVKPGNVLITPDDRAVLLDFGVAYLTGPDATRLTRSFAGSPLYAAPEQISNGAVDVRTDVYLLGVTTYEALTGSLPFHGRAVEAVFRRVLSEDAVPPSRVNALVPRSADVAILKAMEKAPAARYADMASFAADLEALSQSQPIQARAPGFRARTRKWARRRPVRATIVAALLLVALGTAAFLVYADVQRAADRRAEAARLVRHARAVLADYREARLGNKQADEELRLLAVKQEHRFTHESEGRKYEAMLDRAELVGVERDLLFSRVLELLQQARQLDHDVAGVDEVTSRLWLERAEEARAQGNLTAARRYRAEIAKHDPDGRHTGVFLKSGNVRLRTRPAGFEVYGFRRELQRDVVPGGDRRLVPVPLGGAATPVPPGTWTLRVVKGAGDVQPGDQILDVLGHAIQSTFLAAATHGKIQRGDRLVSIGDRPIRLAIDVTAPPTSEPTRYVFDRDGEKIEVAWTDPPIALLSAAEMAERGEVPARLYQHGTVRDVVLPKGLVVRATAVPLFCSAGCLVGRTPMEGIALEPGRYVFLLRKRGYEDVVVQQDARAGRRDGASLVTNRVDSTPTGFVFISHGHWGGESFWIQEREVTNSEYLGFLNDPRVRERIEAARAENRYIHYPRNDQTNSAKGGYWPRGTDGQFALARDWPGNHPVVGISLDDAKAYAKWRSERDGRPYAIPTRREWKLAIEGNSSVAYPFGDSFRHKWVSSLHVRPKYRGLDPVMSFPIDESATGVYDMSGSVIEWLDWDGSRGFRGMAAGGSAMRGLAWEFATVSLHPRNPDFAGGDCGFRLVFRLRDLDAKQTK